MIHSLYKDELNDRGFDVYSAYSGIELLNDYDRISPDLVILDISMPSMDGLEALRKLRLTNGTIPIILNSAFPEFKGNIESWAATEYVTKSSDLTELIETIDKYLRM